MIPTFHTIDFQSYPYPSCAKSRLMRFLYCRDASDGGEEVKCVVAKFYRGFDAGLD